MSLAIQNTPNKSTYLHSKWADFILLGGGSLAIVMLIRLVAKLGINESFTITFIAANFINHPHFAHSYQLFYRNYIAKISHGELKLRAQYFIAGILVPIALSLFFTSCIISNSPENLALTLHAMFFFVGWHYVKQGYGIILLDATLKQAAFTSAEKKILLLNAYIIWALSWILINSTTSRPMNEFFGIPYAYLSIPKYFSAVATLAAAATSICVIKVLWKRFNSRSTIPWNGLSAYVVSIYPWLLWRDPVMLLWFPMLHSLQYLAVVWRFESNRIDSIQSSIRASLRLGLFIAIAMGLGYIGFWLLPSWLNSHASYSKITFGGSLFLFVFWTFINIHHYFLDSVTWRRSNKDIGKYLFSKRS